MELSVIDMVLSTIGGGKRRGGVPFARSVARMAM
jgi:hypothetical protein